MENDKDIVRSFYTECLTANGTANLSEKMSALLADDFVSINAKETKGKAQLIGQVGFFWKLIPDLKWEPQEVLQDGNKVIVNTKIDRKRLWVGKKAKNNHLKASVAENNRPHPRDTQING